MVHENVAEAVKQRLREILNKPMGPDVERQLLQLEADLDKRSTEVVVYVHIIAVVLEKSMENSAVGQTGSQRSRARHKTRRRLSEQHPSAPPPSTLTSSDGAAASSSRESSASAHNEHSVLLGRSVSEKGAVTTAGHVEEEEEETATSPSDVR